MPRRSAALSALETSCAYSRTMNPFSIYVFEENTTAPTFEQIRQTLSERARTVPLLGVRVVSVSSWIYPRWTPDPTSAEEKIRELEASSWRDVLAWLEVHVDDVVEPTVQPWRLTAACGVAEVPGAGGLCTVVLTQHSHALADALAWAEAARALFGGESTNVGPETTVDRVHAADVVRELASIPFNLLRACRPLIRLAKFGGGPVHSAMNAITRPPTAIDRWIRVAPTRKEDFRVSGATVTTSALWRASVGIENYCREFGLDVPELSFDVPLSIRRDSQAQIANEFIVRAIDAELGKDDATRLASIESSMTDARRFARGPDARLTTEFGDLMPARLVQRDIPQEIVPVSFSSYFQRGSYELHGQPCIWSGGGVGRDNGSLSVRAVGYGDIVTLSLSGNSHVIAYPDVLVHLMMSAEPRAIG